VSNYADLFFRNLGNVFGGTALSSYGGFWMGLAIILIPGGFQVESAYATPIDFYSAFALYVSCTLPLMLNLQSKN
jgi:succinate-acetate transporter protein